MLIEGETGTGKEQVARAIHQRLQRRAAGRWSPSTAPPCRKRCWRASCSATRKGAFTGAVGQRPGRFELADGGTIFLDEVGDVPAAMQAKLLRVLQERRFERVGGTESIEVDVRVIAATNRSLLKLVEEGKFREDLYLPPQRGQDRPAAACASGPRTSRCWRRISPRSTPGPASRPSRSRPRRWRCCSTTAGRATSASWKTPSSAPASPRGAP